MLADLWNSKVKSWRSVNFVLDAFTDIGLSENVHVSSHRFTIVIISDWFEFFRFD